MICKIFVCYHKPSFIVKNENIIPIHVGKDVSHTALDFIGDNTGTHISAKNPYFCELTATYWIWKNVRADIVGLFHYRRFLNFTNNETKVHKLTPDFLDIYGINERNIQNLMQSYDMILPKKSKPCKQTLYDFYALEHIKSDMDLLIRILKEKYPTYSDMVDKVLKCNSQGYFANMVIAKKPIFDMYAAWLFDILFEMEKQIQPEVENRDTYQKRVYGFLSERLTGLFVALHPELKIKELPVIFVEEDRRKWCTYKLRRLKRKILSYCGLKGKK